MKYDAFISYRHAELDLYIAKKLHKGLETFKVPRAIAKRSGKKNIRRVFRDQEELPIGSDLGDNIESALAESEFLLVICSPRTPESYWVQKEISTFIRMHDREHVLAVLVEGEPAQAFPQQLLEDEHGNPVEPLAADVRGESRAEIHKKLKTELMRLAAPLLHCGYDDLRQRHRERRMKKIAAFSAAIAVFAVAFGVYSAYNAELIKQNFEGKQRNQSKYLADLSLTLLEEGDRKAAALVALEALPSKENDRPYVAEAQYALSEALRCYDTGNVIGMDRSLHHDLPVKDFHFHEGGKKLLSIDQGDNIYVWDVDNGEKLAQLPPAIDENGYVVTPVDACVYEGNVLICDNNGVYSVDFDGKEKWQTEGEGGFYYCEFHETAKLAACVSGSEVIFFDMTDGHKCFTMPNYLEGSYSGAMAFNEEGTRFAISHLTADESAQTGCVSVFDFETQTVTEIETAATYISDLVFTMDDCLALTSVDQRDLKSADSFTAVGYVEKIDIEKKSPLWRQEFEYQIIGFNSAGQQIKSRSYWDEETGVLHDEVLMSADNKAYTWDSATGSLVAKVEVGSGILRFLVSAGGSLGYLGESSGAIDIVDMSTGIIYSNATIETGKVFRDMAIQNGAVVIRAYESPALTVMKYHEGTDMAEVWEFENSVHRAEYSEKETYYAVSAYGKGLREEIYFFQSKGNTFVGQWTESEGISTVISGFVSDREYVIVNSGGTVLFYDVPSGQTEELEAGEEFAFCNCDRNEDGSLILLYNGRNYCIVDLNEKKILAKGEAEATIFGAVLSEDGQQIYCSMGKQGVYILETGTGEVQSVDTEGYQVSNSGEIQEAFAVNKDGNLLAVSCQDGMLRVLDIKKMETVCEIPFAGRNRRFIKFSEDDQTLFLQGDDYYFRVYDLKKREFSHISAGQYYKIEDFIVNEDSGTISLVTTSELVILNAEDYERIAQIDGGRAYLPGESKVLCSYGRTLYQFPYMTLDSLKEEAKCQFGEERLTEQERIRYHAD